MTRHTHANQSPLKELSVDAIVELLRANGMRVTKNRLQILDTLLRAEKPLSLDEIQTRAKVGGEAPDYATVFQGDDALGELADRSKNTLEPFLQLLRAG